MFTDGGRGFKMDHTFPIDTYVNGIWRYSSGRRGIVVPVIESIDKQSIVNYIGLFSDADVIFVRGLEQGINCSKNQESLFLYNDANFDLIYDKLDVHLATSLDRSQLRTELSNISNLEKTLEESIPRTYRSKH